MRDASPQSDLKADAEDALQVRASDLNAPAASKDDAALDLLVFASDTLPPAEPVKAVPTEKKSTPPPPPEPVAEEASDEEAPASVDEAFAMGATVDETVGRAPRTGAWWTVPLMCAGLAVIACALLIPAADENRRLAYEMEKIRRDVDYFERQSAVNKDFLERVGNDPALVERLAQRQLRRPRENTRLIESPAPDDTFAMSPSALVEVDPPAPMPPYAAPAGRLAEWVREPRTRLFLLGGSLFAVASGVVLGSSKQRKTS